MDLTVVTINYYTGGSGMDLNHGDFILKKEIFGVYTFLSWDIFVEILRRF